MKRYDRNRLYITDEEQQKISQTRLLLGGAGIGSVIAECALRLGFEQITVADGDKVELTNLNRQNYANADIGKNKAEALCKRLHRINPKAEIMCHREFITKENARSIIAGHDIAVNALDFTSELPFEFDDICSENGIPVLHPYNFGWAGYLTVLRPGGFSLREISEDFEDFELKVARYIVHYNSFWRQGHEWLDDVVRKYQRLPKPAPAPQLSVGAWIVAAQCVTVLCDIATGKKVDYFPKFRFVSTR